MQTGAAFAHTMAKVTISSKFQIVIPKQVRERLCLKPWQWLQIIEKGGVVTLVPEIPFASLLMVRIHSAWLLLFGKVIRINPLDLIGYCRRRS